MIVKKNNLKKWIEEHINNFNTNKNAKCSLILVDLDRLREINYGYSFDIGDTVIHMLHKQLNKVFQSPHVYHIHADKFAVLQAVKDTEEIVKKIVSVQSLAKKPLEVDGYSIFFTISFGISTFFKDINKIDDFIKNSEIALLSAKEAGCNTYKFLDSVKLQEIERSKKIESKLLEAIEKNELTLHYQPQYNYKEKKILGLEALVRK